MSPAYQYHPQPADPAPPEVLVSRSSSTASDIRRAGEAAMQRAASAMIAATEAFRRQFQEQETVREHRSPRYSHGYDAVHHDDDVEEVGAAESSLDERERERGRDRDRDRDDHLRIPGPAYRSFHRPNSYQQHQQQHREGETAKPKPRSSVQPMSSRPSPKLGSVEEDNTSPLALSTMPSRSGSRRATMSDAFQFPRRTPSISSSSHAHAHVAAGLRVSLPPMSGSGYRVPRKPVPGDQQVVFQYPPSSQAPGSPPAHVIDFARAVSNFMAESNRYNNSHQDQESHYSHPSRHSRSYSGSNNRHSTVLPPVDLPPDNVSCPGDPPPKKPPPQPPHQRPDMSLLREILFVLMVCLAQVLMLAGIAQAMVPVFTIAESFPNTTLGDMAWYSAAYGLTAGTFVLPSGRLGDVFGHKRIFIVGFFWFGVWSLLAGLSTVVEDRTGTGTIYFCLCRGLQGIGPALLVPNGQAMLGRTYAPGPRKNIVMCLFGAAAPLGFVAGAAMSSLFAWKNMWSWAFYVMAAVCATLGLLSFVCIPGDPRARADAAASSHVSMWHRLDVPGIFLGVSGLVLFNVAWNQVPAVTFATPYTYFLIVIGLILILAFVYVETVAPYPILPVSAMCSSTNFVLACTATGWGCFSIWIWYLILFLEEQRHWSPLRVSAALAPAPVTGLAASLLVGLLMRRKVKPHWIMLIAMVAFTIGSILMATTPVDQIYWANTFVSIFIMPFGMDMSNPAATILVSNSVSREYQGIAASLVVTCVNYAISISLGMAGSVERHIVDTHGDVVSGYRGAQYFGVGLGGLGIIIAMAFLVRTYLGERPAMAG